MKTKLKCFDHSKLKLAGNKDESVSTILLVALKIKEEDCITDINFDRNCYGNLELEKSIKWIATLTNQERFLQEDYTSEIPIVKESVLTWYEFPTRSV